MAPQTSSQVDWTVARCNRLMRPLVTRLQKLRMLKDEKENVRLPTIPSSSTSKFQDSNSSEDESSQLPHTKAGRERDPDWMSQKKKKKGAKAYSARNNTSSDAAVEIGVRTPARKTMSDLRLGELSIPTPYLARNASSTSEGTSIANGNNNGKPQSRADSASHFVDIRKKLYMAEGEDEQAVASNTMKLFLDILHATNESPDPNEQKKSSPSSGSRSLWATCCSKFGAAIAEVEADPDPEEDGLLDAGTVYYGMAEDLELPVRVGGQLHLRLIVRAHATSLMAIAVEEGLIPPKSLKQYLPHVFQPTENSGHTPSPREGELLLSLTHAMVTPITHGFTCPSRHHNHFFTHIMNSVTAMTTFVGNNQRFGLICRQLTVVLRQPDFPVEWLAARRLAPLWKDVLRTLLDSKSPNDIQDTYKLLRQTVSLAVGLEPTSFTAERVLSDYSADFVLKSENCPKCPRAQLHTFLHDVSPNQQPAANEQKMGKSQLTDALSNTLSSMSTMFSSFAIAHSTDPVMLSDVNAQTMLSVLNLLSLDILQHHASKVTVATAVKLSKVKARRAVSILIATILPHIAGCQFPAGFAFVPVDSIVRLMKKLDSETRINSADSTTILDCLPEIVCSIALGTARLLLADSFDTLRNIVRSLALPRIDGQQLSPSTLLFLKQLAFSSAHHFADLTKDSTHYSLINEIEKETGQFEYFDVSKTPFRSSAKVQTDIRGLKWEEGICEWVLASPKHVPKPAERPKKVGKYINLFEFTALPLVPEEDLPSTPATDHSVQYLCNLINSSSPFGVPLSLPLMGKNLVTLGMEVESARVLDIDVTPLKVPLLKRSLPADSDSSDDELSFHCPKSQKLPSTSNLRSSSSGPSKSKSRSKVPKYSTFDDSEDELSFA